jgi:hypothetical protein
VEAVRKNREEEIAALDTFTWADRPFQGQLTPRRIVISIKKKR